MYSAARHFRWLCRDHWPGDDLLTYHNFDLARHIIDISARLGWGAHHFIAHISEKLIGHNYQSVGPVFGQANLKMS